MTWSTPRTWLPGDMFNAALANQYVRDNLTDIRAQIACRAKHTGAAQSISNNTITVVDLDATDFDTGSMVDTTNDLISFTTAGKFAFGACVQFASNSTGVRYADVIYHDSVAGTDSIICKEYEEGYAAAASAWCLEGITDAKSGDYIKLRVWQDSGGALSLQVAAPTYPSFWAAREGPI